LGHAAVSLENARLFEETRQRLQQVNVLLEVSRDVATRLDVTTLLQSILEAACRVCARRSVVPSCSWTRRPASCGSGQIGYAQEIHRDVRMSLDEGFAGWVCREGQADIVVDARMTRALWPPNRAKRFARSCRRRSRPAGVVGVINLDNLSRPGAFSAPTSSSSRAGPPGGRAIENARLFEERERQAQTLESRVRELSAFSKGRGHYLDGDLHEVLGTMVGVVGRQMDVDTVSLWLLQGEDLVSVAATACRSVRGKGACQAGQGCPGTSLRLAKS